MTPTFLLDTVVGPAPSLNLVDDIAGLLHYQFMRNAFEAGTIVAIVAGVIGYFVVLRGLSFAGHAVSHIGYAGATGAVLIGVAPLGGLLTFTVGAAMAMGFLGKRLWGRDVAIGIVMAFSLGLGQLFVTLYKGSGSTSQSNAILFGEVLGISRGDIVITLGISSVTLLLIGIFYRQLLFASLAAEVAEARGVRVQELGVVFLGITGLAVAQSVQVTGVLLIFALLVAPAAIAQRISTRPPYAIAISVVIAVLFTWTALTLAYYYGYPVSFFLTAIAFVAYLVTRAAGSTPAWMTRLRGRA